MGLGILQSLLGGLQNGACVTPVTPQVTHEVTAKPAPALGCTRVTPVTPEIDKGDANDDLLHELLAAGNLACDAWGDSDAARHQMAEDIRNTARHLWADLLQHLTATYPARKP